VLDFASVTLVSKGLAFQASFRGCNSRSTLHFRTLAGSQTKQGGEHLDGHISWISPMPVNKWLSLCFTFADQSARSLGPRTCALTRRASY